MAAQHSREEYIAASRRKYFPIVSRTITENLPTTFTLHSNISEVYERLWGAGCNAARFWSEQPGMQPASQRRAQTARRGSGAICVQITFFAGKKKKRKLQCCQKELCGPLSHPLPTFGGFGVWLSMRGPPHPPWKRPSHTYQHRRIGTDSRIG